MATRANWFLGVAPEATDEPDPFAMPIEEIGERIDLRDPSSLLQLRLEELLRREHNLFDTGVTCAIKDRAGTTCHACPVSRAGDPDSALSALCRIGREQETVLTEMAVLTCHVR